MKTTSAASATGEPVEDEVCPVCRSDAFLNPRIRFLLSTCYHKVCSSCVDRLYAHGSAPCPVCGTNLRKSAFHAPLFGDVRVEKECRVRRLVAQSLNKAEGDFVDRMGWDDYLEEVENLVFDLVNDVDVDRIHAQLEAIRRSNQQGPEGKRRRVVEETAGGQADSGTSELRIVEELEEERARKRQARRDDVEALMAEPVVRQRAPRARAAAEVDFRMQSFSALRINRPVSGDVRPPFDPLAGIEQIAIPVDVIAFPVPELFVAGGLSGRLMGELCLQAAFHWL